MSDDPIVGHKTYRDGINFRHEPLRASEANALLAATDALAKQRADLMPDEGAAIRMMFDAWQRLRELGWNDAVYCPKDGSIFNAIEAGSTDFWYRYVGLDGAVIGLDRFGASAPIGALLEHFGFTAAKCTATVRSVIGA